MKNIIQCISDEEIIFKDIKEKINKLERKWFKSASIDEFLRFLKNYLTLKEKLIKDLKTLATI